jgi:hypothetical protein
MDSKNTPVRVKSGGTQISRRTVARGVAWSAPIAVMATAAPAFAASTPPVVASQCGTACKHPGAGQNDKSYHFTFCFKATAAGVDNNQVSILTMKVGADCREAYAGVGNKLVTVAPNATSCVYIDAPGFTESSTDPVVLYFSYQIGGETFTGCANGQVTGDVCGTGNPNGTLAKQPGNWPHDAGIGDDGITTCVPAPSACTATPCVIPAP